MSLPEQELPVAAVLPDLCATLRERTNAVLIAPPGAGKTTAVAPALLGQHWCTGQVLLLSPRRIAARAAAERMAMLAGEPVGRTIGYATRMDTKRSAATRILVLTEGIFRSRIQADPELHGVSAVLFDEVHERSLDSDFGMALALDAQGALRPDLRLIAMSATLDGARFASLLGDAAVLESEGRPYPLELRHVGRRADERIEAEMAAAILQAARNEEGGILAFLPGVAEIERTAERLDGLPADIVLHRLHGTLDPGEQRTAIAPAPPGKRKVVLATAIAETSLTLDGIRIVVDSGLARRPRFDRAAGMTRLVTERVSQAAARQRAGRAARQGPGIAIRLWEAAGTAGLPAFDPPALLEADLSSLLLDCAIWGETDPTRLRWLDPPPPASLAAAREHLLALGAIDQSGRPTAHGRALASLPLPPRLGHMLLLAPDRAIAAEVAVLLSERGLGGQDIDLDQRLRRWRHEGGRRAAAARALATRWASLVADSGSTEVAASTNSSDTLRSAPRDSEPEVGEAVAIAFPDRIARRRDASGEHWHSTGGRGFRLDPLSSLAREEWLAVAETAGSAGAARILSAAPIPLTAIERLFAREIRLVREAVFDRATGAVAATRERRLGALRLSGGPDDAPDPVQVSTALLEGVRTHGIGTLPWDDAAAGLRARVAFARDHDTDLADLSDAALTASIDAWLPSLLVNRRRLDAIPPGALIEALYDRLGWAGRQALERIAPTHLATPAGSTHTIDYASDGGPSVALRPQALFGMVRHPMIAGGRVPLVLSLTSPAGRPIQTTRDLPGFWGGSWAAVAKEMRGRYPRHPWPEDPAAADPTLRTKRRS